MRKQQRRSDRTEGTRKLETHLLPACIPNPPRFGGTSVSKMGRGSVGCDILCLRDELVLERGSLELMDDLPTPPELERLNHFVGLVKSWVKPPDGDEDRGVLRKLAGEDGEGVVVGGGLRVLEAVRRGAMGRENERGGWSCRGSAADVRRRAHCP